MMPVIHMGVINEAMLAVSGSLPASIVVKVTVTTALGLIGAWLARGSRAAVRHTLLAAAFAVLLALPAGSILASPIRIAVKAPAPERVAPGLAVSEAIPTAAPALSNVTSVVPLPAGLSLSALLFTGWLAGMALFLLPAGIGLWQVRSSRRSALPWRRGQLAADTLALESGAGRRIEVLLHEGRPGPMTCGVVHPAIVLPQDAQTWEDEDLNRAIVHELEHVRRGDWVTLCLARVLCAVYWFHPLVWMAWRKLALEAERSCDDAVLGRSEATAYADQLVGLAKRLSTSAKSPLLAMANRADLATRVGAVLDNRQRRGRAGKFAVALACTGAVVLVLTMSPLTMIAAPQTASTEVMQAAVGPRTAQVAARVAGTDVRRALVGPRAAQVAAQVAAPQAYTTNAGTAMPRFSVTTRLVIVNVTVPDIAGQNIEGLRAGDIAVTEDGKAQNIMLFEFQKLDVSQATPTSPSSSYILGYYSANQNADGKYRQIKVTRKDDTSAKLYSRMGYYTDRSPFGGVDQGGVDPNNGLGPASPVAIYKPEPQYSEEARKARWSGMVTLWVEVDASGQVTNINVMKPLGLGLDEKAVEAVSKWKFQPGMKGGQPVPVLVQVDVTFRLL
jgi:TonB family protein